MSIVLNVNNKIEWSNCLQKIVSNSMDVYFTPSYNLLYEHNGDGEARCFVFQYGNETILYPFLINSVNNLGYELDKEYYDIQGAYGYNGIIASSRNPQFIAAFHKTFDEFCQQNNIIAEFTRFHPLLNNQELASPLMKTFFSRHTVKLDLTQLLDDIWMKSFSAKNRNVIRKAEKEGVTVVESDDFQTFRKIYDQTMRNVNAEDFYFFPQSYYDEFKQSFGDDLILCFAMYEDKPIAGSLFMFSKDYAHYHLSGRDKDYYKIAANNLVLWYGIQKAKERGCKCFHFGGGTSESDDDPLLHFKHNFSQEEGEFWIGKRVHNQEIYNQVVAQWKEKFPESYDRNKSKLLGYREIPK